MELFLSSRRQVRQCDRLLSVADGQRQSSQTISRQGSEWHRGSPRIMQPRSQTRSNLPKA